MAVGVGVVGIVVGWLLSRRFHRRAQAISPSATNALDGARLSADSGGSDRSEIRELQEELRAERSLLDEVAARNGVSPRAFRQALARDYLHLSDPHRSRHGGQDVVDLEVGAVAPDHQLGELTAELDEHQRLLTNTRVALAQLRHDIEELVRTGALAPPSSPPGIALRGARDHLATEDTPKVVNVADPRVIDLREEVADLRSRVIERGLEADRLARALKSRPPEIRQQANSSERGPDLNQVARELSDLRIRLLDLQTFDGG